MSTYRPTQLLATTDSHSAHAAPCLESAPYNLDVGCSQPMHTASTPPDKPTLVPGVRFHAQSAPSTPPKQHSIPIHPPR